VGSDGHRRGAGDADSGHRRGGLEAREKSSGCRFAGCDGGQGLDEVGARCSGVGRQAGMRWTAKSSGGSENFS
jgi:hypothetical protein